VGVDFPNCHQILDRINPAILNLRIDKHLSDQEESMGRIGSRD